MEGIYSKKDYALHKLKTGDIYISFNPWDYKNIFGYYLYDNYRKILIWTKYGKTIYNGFVDDVNDELFELGIIFIRIEYPKDCDLYILHDWYFELIHKNLLKIIFQKKDWIITNPILDYKN